MTVAGAWENEYGSRMSLSVEGGVVRGSYESTTGSTGRYAVLGCQVDAGPTIENGQPVALAISWHSFAQGPPDASWHWVSSLGGQVSVIGGEEVLILNHYLVAASAFPGICKQGIYVDKLTYRRVAGGGPLNHCDPGYLANVDNPLTGTWTAPDGTGLELALRPERCERFGVISGTLRLGGRSLEAVGLADLGADDNECAVQAVAMAAVDPAHAAAVALAGWLDRKTGALGVQSMTNYATPPDRTYLQTAARPLDFSRAEAR